MIKKTTVMIDYCDRIFTKSFQILIVTFFSSAIILYTIQMIFRIFFLKSIFWIDPVINYLFTISALIGAALAARTDQNIKIDLLKKYAHLKPIRLISLGFSFAVSVGIFLVFVGHFRVVLNLEDTTAIIPKWVLDIPYLFLFLGSLFYFKRNIIFTLLHSHK